VSSDSSRASIRLDQVGQAQQDAAAVGGGHAAPGGEGTRGGSHRLVHIGPTCERDLGDGAVVVRVERGQGLARFRVDKAAVDEQLVAQGKFRHGCPLPPSAKAVRVGWSWFRS
jgi:hypothetical protein